MPGFFIGLAIRQQIIRSAAASALLTEGGDRLLLESGAAFLLE